jgi:hypothetical protein
MLKDAKIHFFAILWFLFWRKKVAIAGLNSLFKPCHVGLPQVSESMSFQSTLQRTTTVLFAFMAERHPPSLTLLGDTINSVFFLVVVSCQG